MARWFAAATLGFLAVFSALTPLQEAAYAARWFAWPTAIYSFAVPGLVAWRLWRGLSRGEDLAPFLCALALFVLAFMGIGISFYPMMVPPRLTISEAAAPDESLRFALVGTLVLVPLILAYTAYAYWVFRGKLDPEEGYH